jgi:hypothetical protein
MITYKYGNDLPFKMPQITRIPTLICAGNRLRRHNMSLSTIFYFLYLFLSWFHSVSANPIPVLAREVRRCLQIAMIPRTLTSSYIAGEEKSGSIS